MAKKKAVKAKPVAKADFGAVAHRSIAEFAADAYPEGPIFGRFSRSRQQDEFAAGRPFPPA